jgi:hypothetical protein
VQGLFTLFAIDWREQRRIISANSISANTGVEATFAGPSQTMSNYFLCVFFVCVGLFLAFHSIGSSIIMETVVEEVNRTDLLLGITIGSAEDNTEDINPHGNGYFFHIDISCCKTTSAVQCKGARIAVVFIIKIWNFAFHYLIKST